MTQEKRSLTPFVRTESSVKAAEVGWAKYGGFEGPLYKGRNRFVDKISNESPMLYKALGATAHVEAGHYDAVNMYDAGICSVGLIQVIEGSGILGVSDLIGEVMMSCREAYHEMYPVFSLTGYSMSRVDILGARGTATRFLTPDGALVDTHAASRKMFCGAANVGREGTWSASQKALAKEWAACIASVFQHKDAADIQRAFVARRLKSYVLPSAELLFSADHTDNSIESWELFRVLYLSFAVNSPGRAAECFAFANARKTNFVDCFSIFLRRLMLVGPPFYPERLKKTADALRHLTTFGMGLRIVDTILAEYHGNGVTVLKTQAALVKLGYDLGAAGPDGIMGSKTKKALYAYAATRTSCPLQQDADGLGDWAMDLELYQALYEEASAR